MSRVFKSRKPQTAESSKNSGKFSRCGIATARGDFLQKRGDGSQINLVCGFAAAFVDPVFSGTNLSCVWILQITWRIQDRPQNPCRR